MTNLCFHYAEYHETKQKSQTKKDYDKYYLMEEKNNMNLFLFNNMLKGTK